MHLQLWADIENSMSDFSDVMSYIDQGISNLWFSTVGVNDNTMNRMVKSKIWASTPRI